MSGALDLEIRSQPELWERVGPLAGRLGGLLPPGRVMFTGCGTSLYVSRACASLWESAGRGEADAFAASEAPSRRPYGVVVAVSRSGTTSEVLDALGRVPPSVHRVVVTAVPGSPLARAAHDSLEIPEADERSIVQTRFATTVVSIVRALVG
ncbi:MAG: SIS domain-containing protein, partial [Actinomycetota bacterium]